VRIDGDMTADADVDLCQLARSHADRVHSRLVELGATVATAESLTGGLIGVFLTEAPATSVTFRGGLIVYGEDTKHHMAGVDDDLLAEQGPVHPAVAEQLAVGARERMEADYGVGITGVAGPGTQGGRPVGEVHVGIASTSEVTSREYHFDGTRDEIRLAAAAAALADLVAALDRHLERTEARTKGVAR
jgi:nicotinamide-nucleotide amidase